MGFPCVKCGKVIEVASPEPEREVVCEGCQATELAPSPQPAPKKPSYWVSDDDLAHAADDVSKRPVREADLNSSLVDIRTIMEESTIPSPSKRTIDSSLINLQASPLSARIAPPSARTPAPPPSREAPPKEDDVVTSAPAALLPPTVADRIGAAPASDHVSAATQPLPSDSDPPPPMFGARARVRALAPWLGGGAVLLIAVIWLASGDGSDAPDGAANTNAPEANVASSETVAPVQPVAPADPAAPVATPPGPARKADRAAPSSAPTPASPQEPTRPAVATAPDKPAPATTDGSGKGPFNRGAAMTALSGAAGKAAGCRKPSDPKGTAKVTVTFAPTGKVSRVEVGPPYAGTGTAVCVAGAFRSATVPPFDGGAVPASKSVSLR